MSLPADKIGFAASHQPALLDGEYTLTVKQQIKIDDKYGWGAGDQWAAAPSTQLKFAVAGPRFGLDPDAIQSQFPPPKSTGEYYSVLPHVILTRTTLPWERKIDNSAAFKQPTSWLALLLFDEIRDGGLPKVSSVTVQDLLTTYGGSATPDKQPEFVKILDWKSNAEAKAGELKLEVAQHPGDRLTVIDVPKQLLYQIMPSVEEIAFLNHVRTGQDAADPAKNAEYPVILCNRLPSPGTKPGVGTQSTVHLVSLEGRLPLLQALTNAPQNNNPVRLVSLASWSFSTFQRNKTFSAWLKEAWCPDAQRTDPADTTKPSTCAAGVIHTLRMQPSTDANAERFLAQGYVPVKHQTRQGNHLVSWYRGPLVPGQSPGAQVKLPVRMSDELVRYHKDVGMLDTTYAAAWELGRMLTLRSKKVSVSLFNWKRANAQQIRQAEEAVTHLPFAPDHSLPRNFPDQVSQWFIELLSLNHVPFYYLVPREEMLPNNSLRFFHLDINWLECLLDGAFSVGRVTSADLSQDGNTRTAGHVPNAQVYSGFLLRSPVVTGWTNLGVEAYTQVVPSDGDVPKSITPTKRLRFDRVGEDVLFCLFEGDIRTIDIHEHRETIHFGVEVGNPSDPKTYAKALRDKGNGALGKAEAVTWKLKSADKLTLNISDLATRGQSQNSADFGVTMIAGVEKVRFIK